MMHYNYILAILIITVKLAIAKQRTSGGNFTNILRAAFLAPKNINLNFKHKNVKLLQQKVAKNVIKLTPEHLKAYNDNDFKSSGLTNTPKPFYIFIPSFVEEIFWKTIKLAT